MKILLPRIKDMGYEMLYFRQHKFFFANYHENNSQYRLKFLIKSFFLCFSFIRVCRLPIPRNLFKAINIHKTKLSTQFLYLTEQSRVYQKKLISCFTLFSSNCNTVKISGIWISLRLRGTTWTGQ